ncbi:MAG: hypothetical protein ACR2FN_14775 [Chitinophagaceae bacterium]
MRRIFLVSLIIIISVFKSFAQNGFPDFSIEDLGKGRIRIGWFNQYGNSCIQINVQKSYDSLKYYRTVFVPQSPELPQNGFVDEAGTSSFMYYRIFYVLNGGAYYFTKAKHAASGFVSSAIIENGDPNQTIKVIIKDTVSMQLNFAQFKRFKDSIFNNTRDSLFSINSDEVILKPYIPQGDFIPSMYVYTDRSGYININVPDAKQKNYSLIFFDSDYKELFTIKHLDYSQLILDKADFVHGGWFLFELYEGNKLKERNRFFLQKDF